VRERSRTTLALHGCKATISRMHGGACRCGRQAAEATLGPRQAQGLYCTLLPR
jgi:hypothetical protein